MFYYGYSEWNSSLEKDGLFHSIQVLKNREYHRKEQYWPNEH